MGFYLQATWRGTKHSFAVVKWGERGLADGLGSWGNGHFPGIRTLAPDLSAAAPCKSLFIAFPSFQLVLPRSPGAVGERGLGSTRGRREQLVSEAGGGRGSN